MADVMHSVPPRLRPCERMQSRSENGAYCEICCRIILAEFRTETLAWILKFHLQLLAYSGCGLSHFHAGHVPTFHPRSECFATSQVAEFC